MIKGCQREMIVLQTRESALFESAYFVLRRGRSTVPCGDMLAESNRIIGEGRAYLQKRRKWGGFRAFLCGFCVGFVPSCVIMLIILL